MERIVTAIFSDRRSASDAREALRAADLPHDQMRIMDREGEAASGRLTGGTYDRLCGTAIPKDERATYVAALDRGDVLLQARVHEAEVERAVRILTGEVSLSEPEKTATEDHRFGTRDAFDKGAARTAF